MCSRYSLTKEEITILIGAIEVVIKIQARFNVAPTSKMPVIRRTAAGIQSDVMTWGWQPAWSKTLLINGQAETVETKPTFSKFILNRCLIPADGFYEWTPIKQPIRFTMPDNSPFCFAGLWLETTRKPEDVEITERKFIILTTTPNETVKRFHNRMPFIVAQQHYAWWLGSGHDKDEMYRAVLDRPDKEDLHFCPVQCALNNSKNEGAELIRPDKLEKELF